MSGSAEEPSVVITASPHSQPAVLMLARACIALARLQLAEKEASSGEKPRSDDAPSPAEEQGRE
jgi:hypothetical protein